MGESGLCRTTLDAYGLLAVVARRLVVLSGATRLDRLVASPSPWADNEVVAADSLNLELLRIRPCWSGAAPLIALCPA